MNDDKARDETTVEKPEATPIRPKNSVLHQSQLETDSKPKTLQAIFLILVAAIVGFGGGWLGAANREAESDSPSAQRVVLDKQSDLISSIAEEVGQSVVSINVTSEATAGGFGFFGQSRSVEQQSAGTGVIISDDGLVITNRHVIPEGTTDVSLIMDDGTELNNVEVVGRTSDNDTLDIAFLRITDTEGQKLVPAKIGKSGDMRVGDSVVAIGNALGQFQNTVTTGIISGFGRSVQASDGSGSGAENLNDLFQTDAAINQGNSGGPLVNLSGEVIGINTAVAGGDAENIGFAIPIDNISGLIQSVSKNGKLERPYLGVVYISLTDSIAKELNLSANRGAYIPKSDDYGQDTVMDGGPADKAGVKEGDIITKVDGTDINERNSLASLLGKHQPGDKVKLTINRDGKTQTVEVELGTMPTSTSS